MNHVHLQISGVNNSQMKTSLKNSLDKVKGVQEVNIDMGRSTVEVGFNEPADESLIKDCITDTGIKLT